MAVTNMGTGATETWGPVLAPPSLGLWSWASYLTYTSGPHL